LRRAPETVSYTHLDVYKRQSSGRVLRVTANHPLSTLAGWVPAGDLAPGDRVAVARTIPESEHWSERSDDENPNVDTIPIEVWAHIRNKAKMCIRDRRGPDAPGAPEADDAPTLDGELPEDQGQLDVDALVLAPSGQDES